MTPEEFEQITPLLLNAFESAAFEAIEAMGDDLKGVSWFSATAEDYCASTSKAA